MFSRKYCFIVLFFIVNIAISCGIFLYDKYSWYLIFISLGNVYRIIFILIIAGNKVLFRGREKPSKDIEMVGRDSCSVGVVIPCYTESKQELMRNFESLSKSVKHSQNNMNVINIVVIDGRATGKHNTQPTDEIVMDLLKFSFDERVFEYTSWKFNSTIQIQFGVCSNEYGKFVVIGKTTNVGKKDSLIIVRELIAALNKNDVSTPLFYEFGEAVRKLGSNSIRYLVGVDADTRFSEQFMTEMIESAQKDEDIVGVSGYAVPDDQCASPYNFLYLYQAFEYHLQQGLTRYGQSIFGKVTCLPGCAQLWKMDERTLGKSLDKFKQYKDTSSILQSIRALLGEDRRYTGLVLYDDTKNKTILNTRAKAYTRVPDVWSVFLGQRRRWFLSSQVNNIRDMMSNKLPLLIRFVAFTQLWNSAFVIVNSVAMIKLFVSLQNPGLYTIIALGMYAFIFLYKLLLCAINANSVPHFLYLTLGLITYSLVSQVMNLIITFRGFFTMTDFKWGPTQETAS
jgi:chitin synthase